MRKHLTVVGVTCLLLGLDRNAPAQSGDRLSPIVELTDEEVAQIDLKDGSVEDWRQVVGEPTLTALDFRTDPALAPYDPADLDFRIWLAWHRATNHIYIAMERSDDLYFNGYDRTIKGCPNGSCLMGRQDSYLAFYVDGDHSGGQFNGFDPGLDDEERLLLTFQQAQWYQALAEVHDAGPYIDMLSASLHADWFSKPPYAEGGGGVVGENPTISVTEFYVTPFDRFVYNSAEESVVSELYLGKTIGFAIGVIDTDTENHKQESIHYLRAGEVDEDCAINSSLAMACSDTFADGLLLGPGGTFPESSAVESSTWARIKASFGR